MCVDEENIFSICVKIVILLFTLQSPEIRIFMLDMYEEQARRVLCEVYSSYMYLHLYVYVIHVRETKHLLESSCYLCTCVKQLVHSAVIFKIVWLYSNIL